MRKLMLLITVFGFIQTLNAQECKFQTNEIDKFTNSIKFETKTLKMSKFLTSNVHLSFKRINDSYYINFAISPGSTVVEDYKLLLKCDDGTIIEAKAIETSIATYTMGYAGVTSNYSISKSNLQVMAKKTIETIRIEMINGYVDFDVPQKNKGTIIKNINCLLNATL